MELSKAYSEINRLLKETNSQREVFLKVASKLEQEILIVCKILRAFAERPKYPYGTQEIHFNTTWHNKALEGLRQITKEELEKLVNQYSPEELEIIEICPVCGSPDMLVKAKLKGVEEE